jgi:hypothetical protein
MQNLINSLNTDNLTFSHPIIGPLKWSDFLDPDIATQGDH